MVIVILCMRKPYLSEMLGFVVIRAGCEKYRLLLAAEDGQGWRRVEK